jgi:succinate dehydrogenase/fumarate reductase flavoprotein subunit
LNNISEKLSRRKFMAASSAAIAAPLVMSAAGAIPQAKAEEKNAKAAGKKYDFVEKKECDLVVLGAGGSGLVAAVRAAQLSGKKVIVLEKAAFLGGGMRTARTIRTFRSKWQQKRNLPDHFVEYANLKMEYVLWSLDPKVVENSMLGTGQFFDWLCEMQGEEFEKKFTEGKYKMADSEFEPIGPQIEDSGMSGPTFGGMTVGIMKEKAKSLGVDVLTKHPVVDIEVENGKIVAAIAKSEKGYVRVACKCCILATGSWIANDAITKKFVPDYFAVKGDTVMGAQEERISKMQAGHGNINYTGDGIPLAEKIGAWIDWNSFCIRLLGPMAIGMGSAGSSMADSPYAMTVNLNGKRFCCEPVGHLGAIDGGHVQVAQPHARGLNVFDRNILEAVLAAQKNQPAQQGGGGMDMPVMGLTGTVDEIIASIKSGGGQSGPPQGAPGTSGGGAPGGQGQSASQGAPGGQAGAPQGGGQAPGAQGGAAPQGGGPAEGGQGQGQGQAKNSVGAMGGSTIPSSYWADTLEELAEKMGVDKKAFLETVKQYNEYCEKGSDMEMFKDKKYLVPIKKGPYFAITTAYNHDGAFGGVRVNAEMQAYKDDRKTLVEGLWVTGDFATGRHTAFNGRKRQTINDLSWAVSSGFLAGNSAAGYLKKI